MPRNIFGASEETGAAIPLKAISCRFILVNAAMLAVSINFRVVGKPEVGMFLRQLPVDVITRSASRRAE